MPIASLLVSLVLAGPAQEPAATVREPAPEASVVLVEGQFQDHNLHQGSGVVVAPGVLATNAHVVAGAGLIRVRKGQEVWIVRDFCVEPDLDLCLLKVPGLTLPVASLGADEDLKVGRPVVAIGFPGGEGPQRRKGTLVSVWHFQGDRLIQSDANIQHGSSGGGLFTAEGRLLGITTFMMGDAGQANFSVPISWVRALLEGAPGAGRLVCPGVLTGDVLRNFVDQMMDNPENEPSWEAFARTWVRNAPNHPYAWYAQGIALLLRSRTGGDQAFAQVEASAAAFRRAVALKPDFEKAWNNLGNALDSLNDFKGAKAALGQAIRLNPGYGLAHLTLGGILMNELLYPEAVGALATGLALQPDDAIGWSRLAYCESRQGRWEDASRHYRIALGLSPFHGEWMAALIEACRHAGNMEPARSALKMLRTLNPALANRFL